MRRRITFIVISAAICFIVIPMLINSLFKYSSPISFFNAEWDAGDALAYVGGSLTFIGTMFLGWCSWIQNRDLQQRQDDTFIAEHSCSAYLESVEFSSLSKKAVNFNLHNETIVTTEILPKSLCDYSTFECDITFYYTNNIPVVVRVLNATIQAGDLVLDFEKYDDYFTRIASNRTGGKFKLTLVMSPEEKKKFISNIQSNTQSIFFEIKVEVVSDRYVSTILKCRSILEPSRNPYEEKYVSNSDNSMCFWYENRIIRPSDIHYRCHLMD